MGQACSFTWLLDPTRDEDPEWGQHGANEVTLTLREKQALVCAAQGMTAKETGLRLILGEETVKTYRCRLLLKLDSKNMTEAVAKAFRLGLIV